MIIKMIGAGYLIFLGIKSLISKSSIEVKQEQQVNSRKIFTQGLLTNVLNPKVALFFMAFLPQFVSPEAAASTSLQLLILGVVFAVCTVSFLALLGYFSGQIGHRLNRNPGITKWLNYVSGTILVLLGVKLALTKK